MMNRLTVFERLGTRCLGCRFCFNVDVTAVSDQLKEAIRGVCRVRVDHVEFLSSGSLGDDASGMVDERDWV